ncbi:MAG: Rpn family recombination-promoting nuclease/putative transposase [Paenibacillus sp.]|nr:Rpn family recombination-promoting nuclease/putative transposase [Paenibacillus sp.]
MERFGRCEIASSTGAVYRSRIAEYGIIKAGGRTGKRGTVMAIKRLKPKNDFIFQRLFGEQETEDSLISLLNAILRLEGERRIVNLMVIENKQLAKKLIDDKTGRLDVRAETADRVQINIEVQLTDYRNMPRRSLFYLSKLYADSIKSGGRYEELKKTIAINIVDFRLFEFERFHSTFHFYEDNEDRFMLTDAMEVHFIEYPKFKATRKDLEDPLHRWLLFLDENCRKIRAYASVESLLAQTLRS